MEVAANELGGESELMGHVGVEEHALGEEETEESNDHELEQPRHGRHCTQECHSAKLPAERRVPLTSRRVAAGASTLVIRGGHTTMTQRTQRSLS